MNSTLENAVPSSTTKKQQAVLNRIHHLAAELVVRWSKDKTLGEVLNFTDTQLARIIFESQLERNAEISPREFRKVRALNEGTEKFSNRLKELGVLAGPASLPISWVLNVKPSIIGRKPTNYCLLKLAKKLAFRYFSLMGRKLLTA